MEALHPLAVLIGGIALLLLSTPRTGPRDPFVVNLGQIVGAVITIIGAALIA